MTISFAKKLGKSSVFCLTLVAWRDMILRLCLAEHNRRFMMLHFTKRIATAGFLAGLIILLAPQSAAAMTIQERLVTLKTYFQERGLLFGGFRAPFLLNVAYADDNENENEKERELLLFQETQAAAINR